MSESSDLRVSEPSEKGDDVVHHILVIDDAVLTLTHQYHDEFTEILLELLPHWPGHDQWVVSALLQIKSELLFRHPSSQPSALSKP